MNRNHSADRKQAVYFRLPASWPLFLRRPAQVAETVDDNPTEKSLLIRWADLISVYDLCSHARSMPSPYKPLVMRLFGVRPGKSEVVERGAQSWGGKVDECSQLG